MSRKRNVVSNGLIALLVVAMFILGGILVWIGVPLFAEQQFGEPATYLTAGQKWSYSLQLLVTKNSLMTPGCSTGQSQDFVIEQGSSINQIVTNLEKNGLINDAASLRSYLIYKGLDTQILAGKYQLSCTETAMQIAESIKNIYQDEVVFDILPGWRAEEIAAALPSSGIEVSEEEFLEVVRNPKDLNLPGYLPSGISVEGFLFPGEYTIKRKISAQELVQTFINRFTDEVPESELEKVKGNGITPYQAVILASIVQRETFDVDERPIMASVFYNRLEQGMRLETDPTVQYALGYDAAWGWWKSPLSSEDLKIDSEFNTYLIDGLPPSPISNPELSSIEAVINPANTEFLYFRAKCDGSGSHQFATTYEEQVANQCN